MDSGNISTEFQLQILAYCLSHFGRFIDVARFVVGVYGFNYCWKSPNVGWRVLRGLIPAGDFNESVKFKTQHMMW